MVRAKRDQHSAVDHNRRMVIDLHRSTARLSWGSRQRMVRARGDEILRAGACFGHRDRRHPEDGDRGPGREGTNDADAVRASGSALVRPSPVYRRADIFTTVEPMAFVSLMADFVRGEVTERSSFKRDTYAELDENSVPKLIDVINSHGVPAIQVVYFPGIDLYTH